MRPLYTKEVYKGKAPTGVCTVCWCTAVQKFSLAKSGVECNEGHYKLFKLSDVSVRVRVCVCVCVCVCVRVCVCTYSHFRVSCPVGTFPNHLIITLDW